MGENVGLGRPGPDRDGPSTDKTLGLGFRNVEGEGEDIYKGHLFRLACPRLHDLAPAWVWVYIRQSGIVRARTR